MIKKYRADQLVFEQGLAESREKAKSLIMAARIRKADGEIIDKPGHPYSKDIKFELVDGKNFVSRGALKLLTLLDGFALDVNNLVCLDAGASTGGFTDCLLQKVPPDVLGHYIGAALVGTFFGILCCYGLFGPMGSKLENYVSEEHFYFNAVKEAVAAAIRGSTPLIAVEYGRRAIPYPFRPAFSEMEEKLRSG